MVEQFGKSTFIRNGALVTANVQRDFTIYTLATEDLAPSAISNDAVNIQADSDFVLTQITVSADLAGATQQVSTKPIPLVRVQITDTGSGRNLFDGSVDVGALSANFSDAYELPVPRRFSANSTIRVSFTNYSTSETYTNLRIYLHGYKEWQIKR